MNKYIIFLLVYLSFSSANAELIQAKVVGVTGGNTITALDVSNAQYKVRLTGINVPEKKQPFGQVCKKSLSDLVFNKAVTVDMVKT